MRERLVRHGNPEEPAERFPPLRHGELQQLQTPETKQQTAGVSRRKFERRYVPLQETIMLGALTVGFYPPP